MSHMNSQSTRRRFFQFLGASAASVAALGTPGLLGFDHDPPNAHAAGGQEQSNSHISVSGKGINVLLVHGALADTSTWSRIIPSLQRQNYQALAVQLPLTSLEEDIAVTKQALATLSGPTIVVAHSYGAQL